MVEGGSRQRACVYRYHVWVVSAKPAVLVRFIWKTTTKIQNMAEMSWVEQLRQYNARHAKDKAGKLS